MVQMHLTGPPRRSGVALPMLLRHACTLVETDLFLFFSSIVDQTKEGPGNIVTGPSVVWDEPDQVHPREEVEVRNAGTRFRKAQSAQVQFD